MQLPSLSPGCLLPDGPSRITLHPRADVQLWGLAAADPAARLRPGGKTRAPWEDDPSGVLAPGENKLMLEFLSNNLRQVTDVRVTDARSDYK